MEAQIRGLTLASRRANGAAAKEYLMDPGAEVGEEAVVDAGRRFDREASGVRVSGRQPHL